MSEHNRIILYHCIVCRSITQQDSCPAHGPLPWLARRKANSEVEYAEDPMSQELAKLLPHLQERFINGCNSEPVRHNPHQSLYPTPTVVGSSTAPIYPQQAMGVPQNYINNPQEAWYLPPDHGIMHIGYDGPHQAHPFQPQADAMLMTPSHNIGSNVLQGQGHPLPQSVWQSHPGDAARYEGSSTQLPGSVHQSEMGVMPYPGHPTTMVDPPGIPPLGGLTPAFQPLLPVPEGFQFSATVPPANQRIDPGISDEELTATICRNSCGLWPDDTLRFVNTHPPHERGEIHRAIWVSVRLAVELLRH